MTERPPVTVGGPEWEPGLWWMVLASGGFHLLAIALIILLPYSFLHHPPRLQSYTVDLVSPGQIAGNNAVQGGKGRTAGAPLTTAPKPEAPKPPPPPKVAAPKPPPPPPPKVEAPKPAPQPVVKPAPPPPKAEAKPQEKEVVIPEKGKKPPPPPVKPKAQPPAKAAPAKAAPAKAAPAREVKPPKPAPAEAAKPNAAAKAEAARTRDREIEAAVKRVEQQAGTRGAGTGTKTEEQSGGPISAGPGQGAGGTIKGVEYLLYYNQLTNRIKQSWAWAGTQTFEAAVGFNITDSGEIINVHVTRSSGDPSYDASAVRAVKAASPLPPPPADYRKEFGDVELTFNSAELRQQ